MLNTIVFKFEYKIKMVDDKSSNLKPPLLPGCDMLFDLLFSLTGPDNCTQFNQLRKMTTAPKWSKNGVFL
jgi:hypothetical protein